MDTEDTISLPLLPSKVEKETQEVPDHPQNSGALKVAHNWTGFQEKTLWDWLELLGVLAIPLVVVGATLLFSIQQANLANQQHDTDQKIANQQHDTDQKIANQQHVADKLSAKDQQQAASLQTYIDNIQDLLLHNNLLISKPTDEVAILARARTLTALQGLDPVRKGILLIFVYEAQLIGFVEIGLDKNNLHSPIIDLRGADLNFTSLITINLFRANLSGADLSSAQLSGAHLNGANLNRANLSGANLSNVVLNRSNLSGANLSGTYFSGANLNGANFNGASLFGANLNNALNLTQLQLDQVYSCKGASLPPGLTCHRN